MDEDVAGAVVAVRHANQGAAERWFATVESAATTDEPAELDWDTTRDRLTEQAEADGVPARTVTTFLAYLADNVIEPLTVVHELARLMTEGSLLETYAELTGEGNEAEDEEVGPGAGVAVRSVGVRG
jgi:hypothetical protein